MNVMAYRKEVYNNIIIFEDLEISGQVVCYLKKVWRNYRLLETGL
jgi:hypothetical protein